MKSHSPSSRLFFILLIVTIWPCLVFANIPLPSLFGMVAPLYFYITTFGAAFVSVMLIEAIVLAKILKLPFLKGLKVSFIVNLVSTVFGLLAGLNAIFYFALIALAFLLYHELKKSWALSSLKSFLWSFIPLTLMFVWIAVTFTDGNAITIWAFWGSFGLAYVLTIYIESIVGRRIIQTPHLLRGMIISNAISYIFLAVLVFAFGLHHKNQPMISSDYLYTHAELAAKRGQPDKALYFIQCMRDLDNSDDGGYDSFLISRELIVAEELIRNGFYEHAQRLIQQMEETTISDGDHPSWTESNNEKMAFLKRRLAKARTTPKEGGER